MKIAVDHITGMTAEAEINKIYRGKVVTIKEFGAFVEFLPGKDGLVHVSELANFRVKQPEDIVKMGDEIWVKCLGVDEKGRVRLSRKAAMAERDKEMADKEDAAHAEAMANAPAGEDQPQPYEPRERREGGEGGGDRGPRRGGGGGGYRGGGGDRGPRRGGGGGGGHRGPRH